MDANLNDVAGRRTAMAVLAQAPAGEIAAGLAALGPTPAHDDVRPAETGLVMVRGRAGGTGAPFNLGEMTVTRCTVELDDGTIGHAYIRGRDARHAERAAVFDAMLQVGAHHDTVERQVIARLADAQLERRRRVRAKAAATRVEFLTLVRGEE